LRRIILSLDKTARLILSYARARLTASAPVAVSSADAAILGELKEQAEYFQREFEAGFIPSCTATPPAMGMTGDITPQLVEAQNTLHDLADGDAEPENQPQKAAAARHKPSLFVADAFTNPRHVQFAIKVTLAGMIGYLFYTASDYYGIHTVFYTPLIIALTSTGATIHKGFLRIVGCIIGGTLGEQRSNQTTQESGVLKSTPEYAERLTNAVEACADRIEQHQRQIADQNQAPLDYSMETKDSDSSKSLDNFRELLRAITELQVLIT
jgi:hypothetical protein